MEIGIGLDWSLNLTWDEQAELSREAARLGYTSIWTPEGTGIDAFHLCSQRWAASRDVTPEALADVAEKDIPGFGELFRMLSYQKIKTSTIQSRACAGVLNGTYIFAVPGSPGACKDAWDEILVHQLDIRTRPCNFVELMPRLKER